MNGLLLVGHGTRDLVGQAEFRAVVEDVSRRLQQLAVDRAERNSAWVVEPAFLEMALPTIDGAMARLVERGTTRLVVAPLLLFTAGHAQRDIPAAVAAALAARGLAWDVRQAETLNCQPALVELATRRFAECVAVNSVAIAARDTLLVYVGRGSLDVAANAELARFARYQREAIGVGWVETCYLSMTEPRLRAALDVAMCLPYRRVVVQPHLLFHGQLYDDLCRTVVEYRQRSPEREWLLAEPLGVDPLLTAAICACIGTSQDAGR